MLGGKLIHCQKELKWYTFILSFTVVSSNGFFIKIAVCINKENYIFSRVNSFFEHCLDISLICILIITYTFIIELSWPKYVYFFGFLVLPIYTNIWIYFTRKGK